MPQGYTASYLDPRLFSLQDCPAICILDDQESLQSDDVAIASGQANYEEGNAVLNASDPTYDTNGQRGSGDFHFDLHDGEEMNFNVSHAHSAPPIASNVGEFAEDPFGGQTGSLIGADRPPWVHLKTFAKSVPDNEHHSRNYQIRTMPPRTSYLVGAESLEVSTRGSHHRIRRQTILGKDTEDGSPYTIPSTQDPPSQIDHGRSPNGNSGFLSYLDRNQTHAYDPQDDVESLNSTGSSNKQFPDFEHDQSLSDPSRRLEKSLRRRGRSSEQGSGMAMEDDTQQAHCGQNTDAKFLSPYGFTAQPSQHPFSSMGGQFPESVDTVYGGTGRYWATQGPYIGTYTHRLPSYNHPNQLGFDDKDYNDEHTAPIPIPASSGHYDANRSSSYPITNGFNPYYPQEIPTSLGEPPLDPDKQTREYSSTTPTQMETTTSLPMRRKASGSQSTRRSRAGSLSIIREDGCKVLALGSSPTGSMKGRRKGRLSPKTAVKAARKRKDGTMCVRCKMLKTTCKGDGLPCESCLESLNAKYPCMKANFMELVNSETCNAVFQRSVKHPTMDESRRISIKVPESFNVSALMKGLESAGSRFNIRVTQWSKHSYTLNLTRFSKNLSKLRGSNRQATLQLGDILTNESLKSSDWLKCMEGYDQTFNTLGISIKYNNMPSHNSYCLTSADGSGKLRLLDVEDPKDRNVILFAVQLTRIVMRAVEIEAFATLQKTIFELPKNQMVTEELKVLVDQLAQLLFSLRWRRAWWLSLQDGPGAESVARITRLTHTLYCYFFIAKKKLVACGYDVPYPTRVQSVYANTEMLFEYLPHDDTALGFHAWMQESQQLFMQATASQNVSR